MMAYLQRTDSSAATLVNSGVKDNRDKNSTIRW